jgi:hypothetical protein
MNWDNLPEKYWHCYVTLPGQKRDRDKAVINDATRDRIRREVVEPWCQGSPFTVSGTVVNDRTSVSEIRIVHTPHPKQTYADQHYGEMRAAGIADLATDSRMLPFEKGTDFTHQLLFAELPPAAPRPGVGILLTLCERLPHAAKTLATRSRGKPNFVLEDEYDAQDLLRALVRAYFKYSVKEEPVGKTAATRYGVADLAIEDLGVIIELKYVRTSSDQGRLVNEFAQDLLLYSKWHPLRTFIFLIVNSHDLQDPEALQRLSGKQEIAGKRYETYVVLA